ncbi:unnamed protein product, partial [Hapterophycus canaliculatus]
MELKEAERALEAMATWGASHKKSNESLRKQVRRRHRTKIESLSVSVISIRKEVVAAETTQRSLQPIELQACIDERVRDNLRPRQDNLDESDSESEQEESNGNGKRKKKNQRRRAYGLRAGRLVQEYIQAGTPLVRIGQLIKSTLVAGVDVELDGKTQFTGTVAK